MAKLVRVTTPQPDAAVLVEWPDGTMSSVIDSARIQALIRSGTVPTPVPGTNPWIDVDRSYLALFEYRGPLPDYSATGPENPGRTTLADFRSSPAPATSPCRFDPAASLQIDLTGSAHA